MKFFTAASILFAVAVSSVSAGIYTDIDGNVLGRGLPHEVQLPARSNHPISFARRSELIERYFADHPEEENNSFEVRTAQDAIKPLVQRSDLRLTPGAKRMHKKKRGSKTCKAKSGKKPSAPAASPSPNTGSNKTTQKKGSDNNNQNKDNGNSNSNNSGNGGKWAYTDPPQAMDFDQLMSKTPSSFQGLKSTIQAAAQKYNLQPQLLVGVAGEETTFCTNKGNGFGCMQFMDPSAWAKYAGSGKDMNDDGAQIWAAAGYLSDLVKNDSKHTVYNALRAYNGDPGAGGNPNYQTEIYGKMQGNF